MSQIHKGGRGSKCRWKSPNFFVPNRGGEGRGSITLGQSPKIYTFLFWRRTLVIVTSPELFARLVTHACMFGVALSISSRTRNWSLRHETRPGAIVIHLFSLSLTTDPISPAWVTLCTFWTRHIDNISSPKAAIWKQNKMQLCVELSQSIKSSSTSLCVLNAVD